MAKHEWISYLIIFMIWHGLNTVFYVVIDKTIRENKWIVHQSDRVSTMNGIEYWVFIVLMGLIPSIVTVIGEFIIKVENKHKI